MNQDLQEFTTETTKENNKPQPKMTERKLLTAYTKAETKLKQIETQGKLKVKELENLNRLKEKELEKLRADYKAQQSKIIELEKQFKEITGKELKGF